MTARALTAPKSPRYDGDTETFIAAPLSHGSNPNSNAAGRRREDDENLVTTGESAETAVRRLTPTEACRLQGFPDDWLGPPNEPPDSPRYAALGDAVTVNVAEWIGRRILEADEELAVGCEGGTG